MARRPDVGGFRCVFAVFGAVSPDGIHWTSLPEPLMIQHADTLNTCYYDVGPQAVRRLHPRLAGERASAGGRRRQLRRLDRRRPPLDRPRGQQRLPPFQQAGGRRQHRRRHGAEPRLFYTNGKTTLPDCPDNHVMFPWIWELESDAGSVWLLSSADGWTLVAGSGRAGRRAGTVRASATARSSLAPAICWNTPATSGASRYSGVPIPHKYPGRDITQRKGLFPGVAGVSGLATWPKGRLVALQCDDEGEFATVAIVPPADRIRLNAIVPPTGYIQVAVRLFGQGDDMPGRTFADADRLIGDGLALPVTWKGDAAMKHEGKPVILRFALKQAKLFAVEFD